MGFNSGFKGLNLKDPVKQVHSFYYPTTSKPESPSTNKCSRAGLLNVLYGRGKLGKFWSERAQHKFNTQNKCVCRRTIKRIT